MQLTELKLVLKIVVTVISAILGVLAGTEDAKK
ncbi:DUF6486 family protein [Segatella asaccharophila]|jgi:hypothetical protein